MGAAAIGITEKEDEEQGIHEQDVFDRVVLFLAALTVGLFSRVLGADDAPFRPVMGKRGEDGAAAGAAAGAAPPGVGSSPHRVGTRAPATPPTPKPRARGGSRPARRKPRGTGRRKT